LHRASRADEEEAVPKSEAIDPTILNASGLNLAVVRGEVSSPPDVRVLPSEAVLVQLQVTTRLESETLSTPIAVWNPPAWVEELEPGTEIVVVGRIRRRFFRAAGATASRVELEADVVARATDRRRVRAALRKVNAALEPLEA
jgi:single-stranded DNA-binding protein